MIQMKEPEEEKERHGLVAEVEWKNMEKKRISLAWMLIEATRM